MMPMMMPYPQPLMTAPMQPPVLDKGIGKGSQPHGAMVPPPPPMPATSGMTAASSIPTPWAPSMQMMPFPMAPTSPVVPVPQEDPIKEGQAQQKLSRLLKEMKKEEDNLPSNLQSMAHEMKKQDEKSNMQSLHSAVRALGKSKDDLLEAENARAQLLSQWKHFLQQSVIQWKDFTRNFQASDTAHQASVRDARIAVRKAQRNFDVASKKEQIGKGEVQQISDEEEEPDNTEDMTVDSREESSQKIHEGMNSIVTSLEELSSSADLLEQRVKRPRTSSGEPPSSSFGKAGGV